MNTRSGHKRKPPTRRPAADLSLRAGLDTGSDSPEVAALVPSRVRPCLLLTLSRRQLRLPRDASFHVAAARFTYPTIHPTATALRETTPRHRRQNTALPNHHWRSRLAGDLPRKQPPHPIATQQRPERKLIRTRRDRRRQRQHHLNRHMLPGSHQPDACQS